MQNGSPGPAGSSNPAGRQVTFKRYDPSTSRRLTQLSTNGGRSSDGIVGASTSNTAAPPTRVLGGRPATIVTTSSPRSIASPSHDGGGVGMAMAEEPTARAGSDYFVTQHSDSTAQSLALRERERQRLEQTRQNSYSSSGSSASGGTPAKQAAKLASTPRNGVTGQPNGSFKSDSNGMQNLSTIQSRGSTASGISNGEQSQSRDSSFESGTPVRAQYAEDTHNHSFPRSYSAMATLERGESPGSSSRGGGFKQFVPPSAFAGNLVHSAASSPGFPAPTSIPPSKPNMAAHLSSAFARGLVNVNGMLDGSGHVRLPQSASSVASAVWNKLPPAVQQLKNDIAWEFDDGGYAAGPVHTPAGYADIHGGGSRSPPQGSRSLSLGAVQLAQERERDMQRAGVTPLPTNGPYEPAHPQSVPIAAQLRLDYANKQLSQQQSSRPSSRHNASRSSHHGKQPYRPGYQPKNGVWRDRTDDFVDLRSQWRRAGGDSGILLQGMSGLRVSDALLNEERLLRRLDKLVELHFPVEPSALGDKSLLTPKSGIDGADQEDKSATANNPKSMLNLKRTSDVFGRMFSRAGKGAVSGLPTGSELRAADQTIVKWQDDGEASTCPICGATFNIVTRKHHCRLCGRVVCFLPPNSSGLALPASKRPEGSADEIVPPNDKGSLRAARCSTFILYDRIPSSGSSQSLLGGVQTKAGHNSPFATGTIKEVDLGDFSTGHALASLPPHERDIVEGELERKRAREMKAGVRVCRECLNTIMKRQKKTQPRRTEPWLRLYNVLLELQQDIQDTLTLLSELQSVSEPTVDIIKQYNSAKKNLLKGLTSYDTLAKRIRDLPATAASPLSPPVKTSSSVAANNILSSSQDRLQKAIYANAMSFLGEKMALVKLMGTMTLKAPMKPVNEVNSASGRQNHKETPKLSEAEQREQDEKMARLAVLYEQEALVSGYLDDANARRQFEDAASLKVSLDDLRAEIQVLLD